MALKVTATVVLPKEVTDRLIVSSDLPTAAAQVANYLGEHLPAEVLNLLVVDTQITKKDGAPKKNGTSDDIGSYTRTTHNSSF